MNIIFTQVSFHNSKLECYGDDHAPAAALAIIALCIYVLGFPIVTYKLLYNAKLLMKTVNKGIPGTHTNYTLKP